MITNPPAANLARPPKERIEGITLTPLKCHLDRLRQRFTVLVIPLILATTMFVVAWGAFPTPPSVRDAYTYTMTAQRLVVDGVYSFSGESPGTELELNARVTPGWPLVLAGIYALTGVGNNPTVSAQASAGPITIVMFFCTLGIVAAIAMSARLFGGDTFGRTGGVLAALYLPFSWAATVTLAEHLGALMLSISFYLALKLSAPGARRTIASAMTLGALCALTVLVRPNLLLWTAVPPLYLVANRLEPVKRLIVLIGVGMLAFCLVMSPWWARNAIVLGRFVPLKTDYVRSGSQPTQEADATGAQPAAWVSTTVRQDAKLLCTPWVPYLDVYFEQATDPDLLRIDYPAHWLMPLDITDAILGALLIYQPMLLSFAALSLLFLRRAPRLAILAAAPLTLLLVHWSTLTTRYLYPPMPAIVVMATVGLCASSGWLRARWMANYGSRSDSQLRYAEASEERTD